MPLLNQGEAIAAAIAFRNAKFGGTSEVVPDSITEHSSGWICRCRFTKSPKNVLIGSSDRCVIERATGQVTSLSSGFISQACQIASFLRSASPHGDLPHCVLIHFDGYGERLEIDDVLPSADADAEFEAAKVSVLDSLRRYADIHANDLAYAAVALRRDFFVAVATRSEADQNALVLSLTGINRLIDARAIAYVP